MPLPTTVPWPLRLEIRKNFEPRVISFLASGLGSYPASFARSMKTHFIHPDLWSHRSPPAPIRDVHALCQLHATNADKATVLSSLLHRISILARHISNPSTFEDLLASSQALLVAQCMVIFSEDPSSPYSDSVSDMLFSLGHKLWQQAPIQLSSTFSPQQAWLFGESVRRTIIVAFMLRSVYSLMKQNFALRTPFVDALPFDRRTALWDETIDTWTGVLQDSGDWMVSLHGYTGILETGHVHAIPEFEQFILAACRGRTVDMIHYPASPYSTLVTP
ncbi:hypothetical protein ASPCAL13458 [Aspergillus calidoustus]|uniref:Transcription factor domain-containing protein n=1 Tax=Aspergillus calidoustus TaxID=454130 RepID=A0A0U5GD79_ASPCI|nr:hypothetical protein ASPCAL13458 [Aspergillus calidoustus]